MVVSESEVKQRISDKLSPIHLEVEDESDGCGAKFRILVVSNTFQGLRVLQCHRMVQDAISDVMPQIHAVTINAYSEDKWKALQSQ